MALITGEQYIESIRNIKMQIYMFDEKVEKVLENLILRSSLNSGRAAYDLAQVHEYEDLMTVKSSITGEKINRFTHIHQDSEDLVKKVKMKRLLVQ